MSQQDEQTQQRRQEWSALLDGEADAGCAARLCAAWRDDAAARSTWHAWHLIGDVLRSEDLAVRPRHDAAFYASLRARLGAEAVVLAPQPEPDAARPSRRLGTGAAVAAGFAVVVAAAVVFNIATPGADAPVLAQRAPAALVPAAAVPAEVAVPSAEPQFVIADGDLIRDARLDRYLAAHKPVGGSRALIVPSRFAAPRAVDAGRGR